MRKLFFFIFIVAFFAASPHVFANSSAQCGGDVPSNTNPAVRGGVAEHGTSSNPVRSASIPIGGSIRLDTTPKDASGQPTQIQNIEWIFSNPSAVSVSGQECFTPTVTGVANGTLTVSARYTNFDGSTAITNPSFTLTVGAGGGTAGGVTSDPYYSSNKYCAYQRNGKNVCVAGSTNDETCQNSPPCGTTDANGLLIACNQRVTGDQCLGGGAPLSKDIEAPPGNAQDLGALISQIFTWSLGILGIAVFTMILYSGFEWLTAAGNPGKIGKAKNRIYNAILGALLLLSSYIILKVINPDFVKQASTLPALPSATQTTQ